MGAQRLVGRIAIAGGNRGDDRLVFGQRRRIAPFRRQRGRGQKRHRPMHEVQLLHQVAVVRRKVDLLVEPPVGARQRARVAQQLAVLLDHAAQHADFLGAGVLGGQPGREALQLGAHDIKFRQLVVIERRHDQAAPVARQHRLGFQPLQRLAHRRARHAEPVGQLGFDQAVAGPIGSAVDRLQNQGVGILLGRWRGFLVLCAHDRAR